MKSSSITVRLDKWTESQIEKISKLTGENKSSIIRASLLHVLTSRLKSVNIISENKENTYKKVFYSKKTKIVQTCISEEELRVLKLQASNSRMTVSEYVRSIINLHVYSSTDDYETDANIIVRKQKKKEADERLIEFVKQNIQILKNEIADNYRFDEDSFQDTVLLFVTDQEASKLTGNGKLVAHFKFRYNMLLYRNTMSERERRGHAYDIQAGKEEPEQGE